MFEDLRGAGYAMPTSCVRRGVVKMGITVTPGFTSLEQLIFAD